MAKTKIKKTEKVKAVAKTRKGGAQAQVQNVVVRIGDTKKPVKRKRKSPSKPKTKDGLPPTRPTPPFYDGWYPPQNLTRNGSFPYQVAPPVLTTSGSASSFVAGAPAPPSSLVPPATPLMELAEPEEIQSGYDASFAPEADSGFNVTEFLKEWKQPKGPKDNKEPKDKQREIWDPFLPPEEKSFAPPIPKPVRFAPPVPEPPKLVEPPSIPASNIPTTPEASNIPTTPEPPIKELTNRIKLINEITGTITTLEKEGIIPKRGKGKTEFLENIFGEFGPYKGAVKNYNEFQLERARENLMTFEFMMENLDAVSAAL